MSRGNPFGCCRFCGRAWTPTDECGCTQAMLVGIILFFRKGIPWQDEAGSKLNTVRFTAPTRSEKELVDHTFSLLFPGTTLRRSA